MDKIYLVTGGTGFVGNNVIRALVNRGDKVRTLVRNEAKAREALGNLDVEFYYGDVRDVKAIEQLFKDKDNCEYIFIHTAAVVDISGRKFNQGMYDVNVNGTKAVLEVCKTKQVKRLVYVSSVHAITEPKKKSMTYEIENFEPKKVKGAYAKTKAESTGLVMAAVKEGLNAVIVHPSGIVGPNDFSNTHLTQMIIDYNEGRIPAAVPGGYDFVDVRDVAAGILAAIEIGEPGTRWLLTNKFYTVRKVLDELYANLGKRKVKITLPMWLARFSVPFITIYYKIRRKRPLYTSYSLYTLRSNGNFCHDKASKELNYSTRDFQISIQDTIKFLKDIGKIK